MSNMRSKPAAAAAAACGLLASKLPGRVSLPGDYQYKPEKEQPWSKNCWLPAACFVRPSDAQDVAEVLKIVRETGAKFAVRSGGHNFNPGFSSIDEHGVLIDLHGLKTLDVSEDGVARVGAGNTWGEVNTFLDERGLSPIGGRQNDVGVSGYILGGGMPAFPSLYGLAADNVKNYEVVTADSTVINANANENKELYHALKGGGSNFGIVTRFDIQAYPISTQYTFLVFNPAGFEEVLDATAQAQEAMEVDPKVGMFTSVFPTFIAVGFFYADSDAPPPPVLDVFLNLKSLVQVAVPTTKGQSVKPLVLMISRRIVATLTTKVSRAFYLDVHRFSLETIPKHPEVSVINYNLQPAASTTAKVGDEKGGNSMGIPKVTQTWWSLVVEWSDETEDEAAMRVMDIFQEGIAKLAKEHQVHLDFLFVNDAKFNQDVLRSYGEVNFKKLQSTAAK
ncbi:6-hydroxy-D-nicotine oxidase [Hypoxylon sp. FL1284]|nr:6-hydroxy-D-nicotine oxidase [Hypoxylon sp. FL1284]